MYGWDCYFQARGALGAGYVDIARDVAENLAYQIRHFGKIANTNRSYHLSRTQPPLFTPLARQVFEELERRDLKVLAGRRLLKRVHGGAVPLETAAFESGV